MEKNLGPNPISLSELLLMADFLPLPGLKSMEVSWRGLGQPRHVVPLLPTSPTRGPLTLVMDLPYVAPYLVMDNTSVS